MSTTTIIRVLRDAAAPPDRTALQRMVRSACHGRRLTLEHVHILTRGDRIHITLFVQAGSQDEADATTHLVGARLCGLLPGWGTASAS